MSAVVLINDGLPEPLFRAIQRGQRPFQPEPYTITVTELLAPARQRQLIRQAELNGTPIEIPASRLVAAWKGSAIHAALAAESDRETAEKRLTIYLADEDPDNPVQSPWIVSGQPDLSEDGIISDYKDTKVYALKDGWVGELDSRFFVGGQAEGHPPAGWCGKVEWVQQLNLYAELARRHGIAVSELRLTAFLKDFRAKGFKRSGAYFPATWEEYPWLPTETVTLRVALWSQRDATALLHERLAAHQAAMTELPRCTSEETWGGRRCESWCSAFQICSQANPQALAREETIEADPTEMERLAAIYPQGQGGALTDIDLEEELRGIAADWHQ